MKRIGILALLHESNTFLRQPTTLQHFQDNLLAEGESVLSALRGTPHETGGFLDVLDADPELQPVGIFAARAMPFGPVSADCWNHLKSRLTQCLQNAGPLDGLLVAPHGATVAEPAADADGDWLQLVRELVGQEMLICGTLDLHANVSPLLVSSCDALFGYRTNPHLDQFACGRRAALCLQQALRTATRPAMQLTQIPLVVNIEAQATSEPQGRALFDRADQLERQPGINGVSCLYGFPYSDVPQMGATVIVVAESDQQLATATAHRMAAEWWAMRDQFSGNLIPVAAAVQQASRIHSQNPGQPAGLLDMGDNTGGGSPGDGTILVHAWLESGSGPCLAVLADPQSAAAAASAGPGATLQLAVGGKTDPARHGDPVIDEWTVISISDGKFQESEPRHGGYSDFDQGLTAVLRGARGLTVVATTLRVAPLSLQQILSQGLTPADFAAIILKGVHAPTAAYESVCSCLIRVNTTGATTADLTQLQWQSRRRPLYPLDPLNDWTPDAEG